jgi:hypothetical protein
MDIGLASLCFICFLGLGVLIGFGISFTVVQGPSQITCVAELVTEEDGIHYHLIGTTEHTEILNLGVYESAETLLETANKIGCTMSNEN